MLDLVNLSWFVSWSFSCLFLVPLFLVWFRGFEWVSPWFSLRETWMDVLCIFGIDLVPSNAGNHFDSRIFV
jgi:hypothetical protein